VAIGHRSRIRYPSPIMEKSFAHERVWPLSRPPLRVRIAAIGDLHVRGSVDIQTIPGLLNVKDCADLLIVVGDLTENGRIIEAEAAAELLAGVLLPVLVVLGNHDLRTLRRTAFRRVLERSAIEVLDGGATTIRLTNGALVGIAGATGSGGGFWPVEGPDALHNGTFKGLAVRSARESAALERGLNELETDVRIAAMHYAPTATTLGREPVEKYWMLGNSDLGAVIDRTSPDIVVHGHAHLGTLKGYTPGGVPVRNVALPVVGGVHVETLELRSGHAIGLAEYGTPARCR